MIPFFLSLILGAQSALAQDEIQPAENSVVKKLVEEAITLGVPLYNSGRFEACAGIYRMTLRSLQLLAADSIPAQVVDKALKRAAAEDAERGAWTLRYALDEIYRPTETERGVAMEIVPFILDLDQPGGWYALNDGVMGGISRGSMSYNNAGIGLFSGQLSLANNGGFSSVRTAIETGSLAGSDGIEMRVRGNERTYALLAATADARGSWQGKFSVDEQWRIVRIEFADMALSIRGWQPPTAPPVRAERIAMLGLIISDKNEQPFSLEVDWIRGYTEEREL